MHALVFGRFSQKSFPLYHGLRNQNELVDALRVHVRKNSLVSIGWFALRVSLPRIAEAKCQLIFASTPSQHCSTTSRIAQVVFVTSEKGGRAEVFKLMPPAAPDPHFCVKMGASAAQIPYILVVLGATDKVGRPAPTDTFTGRWRALAAIYKINQPWDTIRCC